MLSPLLVIHSAAPNLVITSATTLTFPPPRRVFISANDPETFISHSRAKSLVQSLIAGLHHAGLKRDDCVCIHSFNSIYYPIFVLAVVGAGGVFASTNPSYTPYELSLGLRTTKARFVLAEPEVLDPMLKAMGQNAISESGLFVLDTQPNQSVPKGRSSWRELLKHGSETWLRFDDLPTSTNTTAALFFSSGTTGLPKAAMISHRNLVAQHVLCWDAYPRPHRLCCVFCLPFFHIGAAPTIILSQLRDGREAYIMRRFELESFLRYNALYKATEMLIVPPIGVAILRSGLADRASPEYDARYSLDSVRNGLIGAAPVSATLQKGLQGLLGEGAMMRQLWGATEMTCVATQLPLDLRADVDHFGSVGTMLPELEFKLVDEEGRDISGPGVRGEMCVKGPTVSRGYFENAKANCELFDGGGWLRSGDLLWMGRDDGTVVCGGSEEGADQGPRLPGGAGRVGGCHHAASACRRRRGHWRQGGWRDGRGAASIRRQGRRCRSDR